MKIKRLVCGIAAAALVISLAACSVNKTAEEKAEPSAVDDGKISLAMLTDEGDITDHGYNQTTYEACKEAAEKNDLEFAYYKPETSGLEYRIKAMDKAVKDGYNVIVMPGFGYADAIKEKVKDYPDVKFVSIDVSEDDLGGEHFDNLFCASYREEIAGYMVGYAVVKMGYKKLGFLGGIPVAAVTKYGNGFVQGADAAAKETGRKVKINYAYGNQFYDSPEITTEMDRWYINGTQVIFACGGDIYASVGEAAQKWDGKMIGVDVDQKEMLESIYGKDMVVTSAMKGIGPTVKKVVDAIAAGKWEEYAGRYETLGLVSDSELSENYVGLPENTGFCDDFTKDDYKAMAADILSGRVTVESIEKEEPEAENVKIIYKGLLK